MDSINFNDLPINNESKLKYLLNIIHICITESQKQIYALFHQ